MSHHDGTRLFTRIARQGSRQGSNQESREAARQGSRQAVSRTVRPPGGMRAPADLLAEHLIEAYRHAAACEDPVALDLIRLALGHVGRTYPPSDMIAAEEGHRP